MIWLKIGELTLSNTHSLLFEECLGYPLLFEDCLGCDCMAVIFTDMYTVTAYHHRCCEFKSCRFNGEVYSTQIYEITFFQWRMVGLVFSGAQFTFNKKLISGLLLFLKSVVYQLYSGWEEHNIQTINHIVKRGCWDRCCHSHKKGGDNW